MSTPLLNREEYIEQAYFFRVYRERLEENIASQEILTSIHEEILTTTRLPMAIEFLKAELLLNGRIGEGMARLPHYFTAFQTFVINMAEEERSRFEQKTALQVLEREAIYRSETPTPSGLFVYQFESICRNRLGYDRGMEAMSRDSLYNEVWQTWIRRARLQLGAVDLAEMIYLHSAHFVQERSRLLGDPGFQPSQSILFGVQEGRIARANRGRDPLYMFAALQRHLSYPEVPRIHIKHGPEKDIPEMRAQIQQLEKRIQLIESELKGTFDLSQFYVKPDSPPEQIP